MGLVTFAPSVWQIPSQAEGKPVVEARFSPATRHKRRSLWETISLAVHEVCRYGAFAFGLFFALMHIGSHLDPAANAPPMTLSGAVFMLFVISGFFASWAFRRSFIALGYEWLVATLTVMVVALIIGAIGTWMAREGLAMSDIMQALAAGAELRQNGNDFVYTLLGDPATQAEAMGRAALIFLWVYALVLSSYGARIFSILALKRTRW